jgi:gliding motility-associated-like protein
VLSITTTSASVRIGQTITLNGTSDSPQYTWTPSDELSCTNCLNPSLQPTTTTVYTLSATNSKLCKNTATLSIFVDDNCGEVFAPSAFSPNDDGNNDTWCIYGPCIHTIDCEIYNRWGQKVFSMSGKEECWDGKVNGVMQEPGVFIFQAKTKLLNGQTKSIKGNFILVR